MLSAFRKPRVLSFDGAAIDERIDLREHTSCVRMKACPNFFLGHEPPTVVVLDAHAEASRARSDRLPDAPHSEYAEFLPPKARHLELRRGPAGPRAAANKRDALGGATRGADQQKHADLRNGLSEHIEKIEHGKPTSRRIKIDVLVPD